MEDQTQLSLENLPVGVRLHPTDEELLIHYLVPKLLNQPISGVHIGVLDLKKYDPWDLLAKFRKSSRDNEIYFFCRCEYNKSTGNRKRIAGGGHWKSTGNPRPVSAEDGDNVIGTKRSLVFHNPAATQFVITEYAYAAQINSNIMGDFVLCKLKKRTRKNTKKSRRYSKLETGPNKKARKEMTVDSTYTQSEERNHLASFSENQQLNITTSEATIPEFTQESFERIDISSSYKDESTYRNAIQMTVTLPCNSGDKENIVSQDFGCQNSANRTDISASYETPFDFDKKNQKDETDISNPINYWSSLLDSAKDPEFQGIQTGETDTPVLEDNRVPRIVSSDDGETTLPKIDVQKWLEEFLELCNSGDKENIVSQDFGCQNSANRTDISASYETPFDFDKKNQKDETDISNPINYWSSLLDSAKDPEFQGIQTGETDTPVLEDNRVPRIVSSDDGETTLPKIDVQKWLEEFLEL